MALTQRRHQPHDANQGFTDERWPRSKGLAPAFTSSRFKQWTLGEDLRDKLGIFRSKLSLHV